jgi:hypothetical protein
MTSPDCSSSSKDRPRIIDRANEDRVIRTSGPGEFNGELGILTGQRAFVACVVTEPGTLLFVPSAKVQEIIANIPELSDILVTAFAARRRLLMQGVVASLTIVGRENDSEVLHLLEFSDRNRIPYRWLDPGNPDDAPSFATCGSPEGERRSKPSSSALALPFRIEPLRWRSGRRVMRCNSTRGRSSGPERCCRDRRPLSASSSHRTRPLTDARSARKGPLNAGTETWLYGCERCG